MILLVGTEKTQLPKFPHFCATNFGCKKKHIRTKAAGLQLHLIGPLHPGRLRQGRGEQNTDGNWVVRFLTVFVFETSYIWGRFWDPSRKKPTGDTCIRVRFAFFRREKEPRSLKTINNICFYNLLCICIYYILFTVYVFIYTES